MNTKQTIWLAAVTVILAVGMNANAGLVDSQETPDGLTANGEWQTDGFKVAWNISNNGDGTWHYCYEFTMPDDSSLDKDVSHFIIQVSENFTKEDILNADGGEPHTYNPDDRGGSTPGLPGSIHGVKFEIDQNAFCFDSTRAPMWGDFYAKDGAASTGGFNYVYNSDFGADVANVNDYAADSALDASGAVLYKVLVPDTIPEPATMILLSLGSILLRKVKK